MTFQSLHNRLNTLVEVQRTTLHLISRLSKLPTSIGSSALQAVDGDARVELSSEIHQIIKEQEGALELLRQEVEDFSAGSFSAALEGKTRGSDREGDKARLVAQVSRLGEDLKQARGQFRKAQLQAKRNAETAKRKERELLFANVQEDSGTNTTSRRRGQEKLSQEELLVSSSSDVTAALRRTHQLMQSELSRSQFAHDTLQESTAALSSLSESYTNLDTLLSSSRTLVSSLLRSQKSDTWYLETAFYILASTILWLVFRRFFYGPLWWFVWLPVKLLYRVSLSFLAASGLLGSKSFGQNLGSPSSTSLIIKPSATGGFPRFSMASQAPSVVVGGGGRGGPAADPSHTPLNDESKVSEVVGNLAEESRQKQENGQPQVIDPSKDQEATNEHIPRNPKKRMWEEDKEARKAGSSAKDEL
ncbi:MAG: hypothetical protein M1812_002863 [Candelaria pacifica]|nr:MAG: hypothetical protein M1812_002863 [Candelaria pacifica]